jgi:hypothetical protein
MAFNKILDISFNTYLIGMHSNLVNINSDLIGMHSNLVNINSDLIGMHSDLVDINSNLIDVDSDLINLNYDSIIELRKYLIQYMNWLSVIANSGVIIQIYQI